MKERPFLFSGPMVRAILDGRKTQTRRGGDLLAAISSDPYWFKKVKGMGEERRDALINAITAWGEDHKPADTRRKQCNNDECQASPSKGIFDTTVHPEGECPECGETEFFTRIEDEV